MMVFTKVIVVVVFATLVCVYGTTPLVTETCAKTKTPDVCATSFGADPRSAEATDTVALARIGIQVLASKYNESFTIASQVVHTPDLEYDRFLDVHPCMQSFKFQRAFIEVDALTCFDAKNFTGAAESVRLANDVVVDCDKKNVTELTEPNKFFISFAPDLITILTSLPGATAAAPAAAAAAPAAAVAAPAA